MNDGYIKELNSIEIFKEELIKKNMGLHERNKLLQLENLNLKDSHDFLKQSEKQYRELIEFLPDAVVIHNSHIILFANAAALSLSGAKESCQLVGRPIMDFVHIEFHGHVKDRIEQLVNNKNSVPMIEEKFIRVDGSVIDAEVKATAINYEGKPAIMVVIRDITRDKELEMSLYRSKARYRQLLNLLPDAVFIHDSEKVVFANDSAARLTGANDFKELIGKTLSDFVPVGHPEIRGKVFSKLFENIHGPYTHEGKLKKMDGSIIDSEVVLTTFIYENQPALMITIRDITNKKRAEQERFRFFELSIDMLSIADFNGYFKELNPAWGEALGFTLSELMSNPFMNFVHPEDKDKTLSAFQDLKSGKSLINFENRFLCKEGSYRTLSWNAIPVQEHGLIYSVARDLTESKESERVKQLLNETLEYDKLKTEFLANISHELRTPLNIILSTLQLIDLYLKYDWGEAALSNMSRHTKVMKQNCYRLLRLINNLIDITKIDSGYLELHPENHNIVSIVEDITMSVTEYAENKGISIIFDTNKEEILTACDPDKIERIILNLLSNAIKFTPQGGLITVNISSEKDTVLISIKDTGAGIPDDKLHLVFERFRQVDKLLTRRHEGSGIGLSLVKSLVEMHGGGISVKSEYGKGSEFIVKLPVKVLGDAVNEVYSNNLVMHNHVERLNIEFSDIYGHEE